MKAYNILESLKGAVKTREDKLLLFYAIVVFFGGALRKWVVASGVAGNAVLMVQLFLPFLLVILRSPGTVSPFKKFPILNLYFLYLVFHIINPLQLTIFHGMLGFIIYGGFWLGLFYYLANREQFFTPKLLNYFILFAAVEIVLGFIQYTLPMGHILNKYAHEGSKQVAIVGDSVRITGTFSYISGYGAFLLFYPFFMWSLIRLNFSLWFVSLGLAFGLVAAFMTGSRGVVLVYLAYNSVIVLVLYSVSDIGKIIGRLAMPAIIGISVIIGIGENPIRTKIIKSYENFVDRFERGRDSGEQSRRLGWDFTYFTNLDRFENIITGIGLGATYQGAIILFGKSKYAENFGYVEGEFVKIILEGGLIILFLKIILATIATYSLSFKQPVLRGLIWFSLVYGIPIVFNVHNASFFLMGIILIDNIVWRQGRKVLTTDVADSASDLAPKKPLFTGYPQVGDLVNQPVL
jgi:hypothetical protein